MCLLPLAKARRTLCRKRHPGLLIAPQPQDNPTGIVVCTYKCFQNRFVGCILVNQSLLQGDFSNGGEWRDPIDIPTIQYIQPDSTMALSLAFLSCRILNPVMQFQAGSQ